MKKKKNEEMRRNEEMKKNTGFGADVQRKKNKYKVCPRIAGDDVKKH